MRKFIYAFITCILSIFLMFSSVMAAQEGNAGIAFYYLVIWLIIWCLARFKPSVSIHHRYIEHRHYSEANPAEDDEEALEERKDEETSGVEAI